MEPIAAYSERFIELSRSYTLYPDRIIGQYRELFGRHGEYTIPLDTLDVNPARVRARRGWLLAGILLSLSGWVPSAAIMVDIHWNKGAWGLLITFLSLGLAGFVLVYLDLFRREHLIFSNKSGAPMLGFIRNSKNAAAIDQFVTLVLQQINCLPSPAHAGTNAPPLSPSDTKSPVGT